MYVCIRDEMYWMTRLIDRLSVAESVRVNRTRACSALQCCVGVRAAPGAPAVTPLKGSPVLDYRAYAGGSGADPRS